MEVRRNTRTQATFGRQSFAQAENFDLSPIRQGAADLRAGLDTARRSRQQVELQQRLLEENNALTADLDARRRDPNFDVDNFSAQVDSDYTDRANAVTDEFRGKGFDVDLVDQFFLGMGRLRNELTDTATGFQLQARSQRALTRTDDMLNEGSKAVVTNIDDYEATAALIENTILADPDLTDEQRQQTIPLVRERLARAAGQSAVMDRPEWLQQQLDPTGRFRQEREAPVTGTAASVVGTAQGTQQDAIRSAAEELGVSPVELAGIASYESAGTLDPSVTGGAGGNYQGIFQFGPEERRKYGIDKNSTFEEQVGALVRFAKDRGYKSGMGWEKLYTTINAGNPNASVRAADQNGTQSEHYRKIEAAHFGKARQFLGINDDVAPVAERVPQAGDVVAIDPGAPSGNISDFDTTRELPIEPATIDPTKRPRLQNADGSFSTIETISIGTEKGEVLIPTIVDGKRVTEEEAIAQYEKTGEHLGIFATPEAATAYAKELSQRQGQLAPAELHPALRDLSGEDRLRLLTLADQQMQKNTASQKAALDIVISNVKAEAIENGAPTAAVPTDEEIIAVYGNIAGPQVISDLRQTLALGKSVSEFKLLPPSAIAVRVEQLRPQPGSPTFNTDNELFQAARKAQAQVIEQRDADPAGYVLQNFPAVAAAAEEGTTAFYAEMDRALESLGYDPAQTTPLPKQAQERTIEQWPTMSPTARRQWFSENFRTMGEDRLADFARGAEGTDMEEELKIYAFARSNVSPLVMDEIFRGRDAIKKDPARRPSGEKVTEVFRRSGFRAVQAMEPNASAALQEAAAALYVAKGGDADIINLSLYEQALSQALGGSAPANMSKGAAKDYTILPPRVSEEKFTGWLEQLQPGELTNLSREKTQPLYGDLKTTVTLNDIIDDGVFVMITPGSYGIKMASDGRFLKTATGRNFVVRLKPQDIK